MTSETHEFERDLGAYALGALEGEERRAVEVHLATCPHCQAILADHRRVAVGLGLATDDVEPPARVKARVLAYVTGDDMPRSIRRPDVFVSRSPGRRASDMAAHRTGPARSKSPILRLAAAASIVLAVAMGFYAMMLREQLGDARTIEQAAIARAAMLANELTSARRDSARLIRTLEVLNAPDLIRVDLRGQAGAPAATGRAFLSKGQGLVFDARQLPALAAGRVYQLWVIAAGAPVSAGVLTLGADGVATLMTALPADLPAPTAVAVTEEPAGGSKGPTTPILLVGEAKG